jgi:hypothetical protein
MNLFPGYLILASAAKYGYREELQSRLLMIFVIE